MVLYVHFIDNKKWSFFFFSFWCMNLKCVEMGDLAKDLASGTAGGAAQLICGHPFDTIKVQLQSRPIPSPGQSTTTKYSSSIHAVKKLVAADGLRGLYNGMGAPLATVAATSAILFAAKGQMEVLLRSEPGAPLSITQQTICGAGAGLAISFITCPTELIKCRSVTMNLVINFFIFILFYIVFVGRLYYFKFLLSYINLKLYSPIQSSVV